MEPSSIARFPQSDEHGYPYTTEWYDSLKSYLGEAGCRQLGFYPIPQDFLLSVVIPIFNEQKTVENLISQVKAIPIRKKLVLVDDGSSDRMHDRIDMNIIKNYLFL